MRFRSQWATILVYFAYSFVKSIRNSKMISRLSPKKGAELHELEVAIIDRTDSDGKVPIEK